MTGGGEWMERPVRLWARFEAGALRYSAVPMYSLGATAVLFGFAYYHLAGHSSVVQLIKLTALAGIGLSICYRGYRIQTGGIGDERALWAFSGTLAFLGAGLCLAATVFVISIMEGARIPNLNYLLVLSGYASAAIGAPILYYHQRLREKSTIIGRLNKRLTILHRTFRHNLRNELAIIQGYFEKIRREHPEAAESEPYRTIEAHLQEVKELIDNTKALRQIWQGAEAVHFDLTRVTDRCIDDVRDRHEDVAIDTELPPVAMVSAHPMLDKAVTELLANAIEHNDGSVEIDVTASWAEGPREFTQLRICDTGSGIPDGELEALRQSEETALSHGSGLGLWLVYWIVEASDGELHFSESSSGGTEVTIHLPIRRVD